MFRKLAITAVFLLFTSPQLMALGLGDIDMQSALNQPMKAVINLTSAAGTQLSDIKVSLASLEAHQRAGLTKSQLLAGFRFSVEKDSAGNAVVRVTSSDPVREPYLEFLLELEWPKGRLLRQYTVLVDPPVTMPAVAPAPSLAPSRQVSAPPTTTQPETEQPVLTAPASVSVPATASEYGPIRRTDTLWSIAQQVRPDRSVSVYQVMQALLRTNPDAFIGGNINQMKAGSTLKLPAMDEIRAMSSGEAFAESNRQYQEWVAANSAAADKVAAVSGQSAAPESSAEPAGQGNTAVNKEASAEPRLSLVAPEGESVDGAAVPGDSNQAGTAPGTQDAMNQQLALATEAAEAGRAQSAELQSRVQELEQQVDTMKRLLELKNHALAQLQHQAGQSGEDAVAAGTALADKQPDAAKPDADAPRVTPKPVTSETATATAVIDNVLGNPLLAGGIVLTALLLGGFLWAANRKKNLDLMDNELTLESRLAEQGDAFFRPAPEIAVREVRTERNDPVHPASHDSDPMTEVDVYLAYGRIQQAEDLLRAALQEDPDSDALQMKLLEVYHAADNVTAFEQAASDYRDGVEEGDERWLKVAAMGISLDPQNDLYRAARPDVVAAADEVHGDDAQQQHEDEQDTLPEHMEFNPDDYSIEIEDEMEGVLATEDEITTKLDLARAYIDMDDKDSARNILDEVIEEGNTDQKQEAQRIIAKMA
jgi:pilus assembly protein FimV